MQERRRYIRLGTPVLVEFPNPETMKTERSFTEDVNETGIRFPTAVKLRVGQQVPLTIELPFNNYSMQTTGEVLWIREISRLGAAQYDVGIQFHWTEERDRQRLSRHLAELFPSKL